VAFSPDGTRLASGAGDELNPLLGGKPGEVKVWDVQTGQEVLDLQGHTARVNSVAFSPDGKRLASGAGNYGKPGEVKVWDAR
jgi:WD40 repeat protein